MTNKKYIIALAALAITLPSALNAQNLFMQRRTQGSLIEDHTAAHVGDLLSIVISASWWAPTPHRYLS